MTILHPELLRDALDYPLGLNTIWIVGHRRPVLIVKATKEAILAAKINKGFKLYVIPLEVMGKPTYGIVSAFFDDADEPLVIRTILFDEPDFHSLKDALLTTELDVHMFDEHDRELLGYRACASMAPATRARLVESSLLPFEAAIAGPMMDDLTSRFSARTPCDDAEAIVIAFGEALFPDDMVFLDLRPAHHTFNGSERFSYSELVREAPGSLQEVDIVRLLQRTFSPDDIYLNPLRVRDKEEIADVIVITATRVLVIQAKDSPNTEQILSNTLVRKKATARKSLAKAIGQIKGAVNYIRSDTSLHMLIRCQELTISTENLQLTGLILLKEMFNDEYHEYSPPLLELAAEIQVPCIALDYGELNMYTAHLHNEEAFFNAYYRVFNVAQDRGEFPRLRIVPAVQ